MFRKLSTKISFITSIVIVLVFTIFTIYLVDDKSKEMNELILEKGIASAKTGKTVVENLLQSLIDNSIFSYSEIFDQELLEIKLPKRITDGYENVEQSKQDAMKKYHYKTGLDSFLDNSILLVQERFLEDQQVVYAILVDKQGYCPTHNIRYSNMLTGDYIYDRDNNRTKRIFKDPVAKKITENETKPYLKQIYARDTGEIMWDISAPVYVKGKYWGSFRVGLSMQKASLAIKKLRLKLVLFMAILLVIITLLTSRLTAYLMKPLGLLHDNVKLLSKGDFSVKQEITSKDEIGDLSLAFNKMVEDLKTYMENLERTTKAKERIENELSIAHDIQQDIIPKLFPAFPNRPEIDLYAILEPAKSVGGDLYDFFFVDKDHLCFVIGDVSDKGVPASLFMAVTKTLIKSTAKEVKDPAEILRIVNNELSTDNDSCMFVTVFCGVLNIKTGKIVYSSAGHNPPLVLLKGKGSAEYLQPMITPPIGVDNDIVFNNEKMKLNKGDILYMYTDGITEAFNEKEEMFGEDELKNKVGESISLSAKELTKYTLERVKTFVGSAAQSDDITILVLKFLGKGKK